jgi:hypothetical protein
VQTCIVHQIRASLRYVNYRDRRRLAADLRPVYTAANADQAKAHELYHDDAVLEFPQSGERFRGRDNITAWRQQYPAQLDFEPRELRFLQTDEGLVALLTLGVDASRPLAEAHALASEIEQEIRRAAPGVADVIAEALVKAGGDTWYFLTADLSVLRPRVASLVQLPTASRPTRSTKAS